MAFRSSGSYVRVRKILSTTPYKQTVTVFALGENSPIADTKYKVDFKALFVLLNNQIQVKVGDLLYIKDFFIKSVEKKVWDKGYGYVFYINDWELKGQYDYKKLHNKDIEYKGADYDEDDES